MRALTSFYLPGIHRSHNSLGKEKKHAHTAPISTPAPLKSPILLEDDDDRT